MQIIAHIDMDAFFASVEELDKPYLRGLPVVIGADPLGGSGRGVVSTANYAARAYGIHSAQPIQMAWRHSEQARQSGKPAVAFLGGRMQRYRTVSAEVFAIVLAHTDIFEKTSVDEGYFDLSHTHSYEKARKAAAQIQTAIQKHIGITCSIGIGPNKMVAKIAAGMEKPNGLTVVSDTMAAEFLAPLPISVIPGVGPKMQKTLTAMRIRSIADVQHMSWEQLVHALGDTGFDLHQKAFGVFDTPIAATASEAKSIGEEETFATDVSDMQHIITILEKHARNVFSRFEKAGGVGFRTVVLTVRFADFETKTRSLTTKTPLTSPSELIVKATKLALPFFDQTENPNGKAFRLVGIRVEKILYSNGDVTRAVDNT